MDGSLDASTNAGSAAEPEDEAVADARRWGLPDDQVAALAARLGPGSGQRPGGEVFDGVWPDNRPAVDAFLAASSQWRTAATMEDGHLRTRYIGLDYAGAAVAWAAFDIDPAAAFRGGLRRVEAAARDALNEMTPS